MPVPEQGKIEGQVLIEGQGVARHVLALTYDLQTLPDGFGGTYQGRQVVADTVSAGDGSYTLQFDYTGEVVVLALPDYGQVWQPDTYMNIGDRLRPTIGKETGYVYECTVPGDSGSTEPVWWIDTGGGTLGSVGDATFKAVESWWPVSHAPIKPDIVVLSYSNLQYNQTQDPYNGAVVSVVNFDEDPGNPIVDEVPGNVWTLHGDADHDGAGALVLDGDGDYAKLADTLAFREQFDGSASTNWTLELGIFIGQNTQAAQVLDWRPDTQQKGLNLVQPAADPTKLKLEAGDGSPTAYEVEVTSQEGFTPGQLVEVAITRNGNDYLLHTRGIYQGKASSPLALDLGTGGPILGEQRVPGGGQGFTSKIVRWRATAGVSRYSEKNYLVEGDTTSYAWIAGNVLNGDFASGDGTHWTVENGTMTYTGGGADPAGGDPYGFYGGGNNPGARIYQELVIPAGAKMFELSAFLKKTSNDRDQAGVGVQFYDIHDNRLEGYGHCLVTHTDQLAASFNLSGIGLVPDDPLVYKVRIYCWVGRPAEQTLNAGGDSVVLRWLTGDFFPNLTQVPFVNADFYLGDLSGWTVEYGSPFVDLDPNYAHTSDYAVRAATNTPSAISQVAVIPAGSWNHLIVSYFGTCSAYQRDTTRCRFTFQDINGIPITTYTLQGTRGANLRMVTSEVLPVPAGAYQVEVYITLELGEGSVLNCGIGGVRVDLVDPLPELEAVILG